MTHAISAASATSPRTAAVNVGIRGSRPHRGKALATGVLGPAARGASAVLASPSGPCRAEVRAAGRAGSSPTGASCSPPRSASAAAGPHRPSATAIRAAGGRRLNSSATAGASAAATAPASCGTGPSPGGAGGPNAASRRPASSPTSDAGTPAAPRTPEMPAPVSMGRPPGSIRMSSGRTLPCVWPASCTAASAWNMGTPTVMTSPGPSAARRDRSRARLVAPGTASRTTAIPSTVGAASRTGTRCGCATPISSRASSRARSLTFPSTGNRSIRTTTGAPDRSRPCQLLPVPASCSRCSTTTPGTGWVGSPAIRAMPEP